MNARLRTDLALLPLLLLLLLLVAPTGLAQNAPEEPAQTEAASAEPEAEELTRKERKRQAKEERIAEYLRKREEKRARKEAAALAREQSESSAREIEAEQIAATKTAEPAPAPTPVAGTPRPTPAPKQAKRARATSRLPKNLAIAQENVRMTALAEDPTVQEYLALIDRQGASPQQLAAFGNFLAQNGLVLDALQYYDVALNLERNDPVLWVNAGTIRRQGKDLQGARDAYARALSINPNNAHAHYNLGSVLDEMNKYEEAILEYKAALSLDPKLGDPAHNPQAANNPRLTAVKLMLYQDQVGNLSLPLIDPITGRSQLAAEGDAE